MYIASAHGHSDVVRALLTSEELKVDKATKAGVTPLYICSQEGHADVARALLASQKADASKAIEAGFTPLMIAVHNGHEVNVQDLLAAGANPSRAANHGQSCLKWRGPRATHKSQNLCWTICKLGRKKSYCRECGRLSNQTVCVLQNSSTFITTDKLPVGDWATASSLRRCYHSRVALQRVSFKGP